MPIAASRSTADQDLRDLAREAVTAMEAILADATGKVRGKVTVEGFEKRVWVGRDPNDPSKIKSKPIPDNLAKLFRGEA